MKGMYCCVSVEEKCTRRLHNVTLYYIVYHVNIEKKLGGDKIGTCVGAFK